MKTNWKKQIKKNLEQKKYFKKVIKCMSNGRDTLIRLIVGLIKNALNVISWYKNTSILS